MDKGAEFHNKLARQHFFIPLEECFFSQLDVACAAAPPELLPIAQAFRDNLKAVDSTASALFRLTWAACHARRFQSLATAERIRALNHADTSGEVPAWAEEEALQVAMRRQDEEISSPEGMAKASSELLAELVKCLSDPDLTCAARELLRQGAVLTWGALEVLAQDTFVALLNRRPQLIAVLMEEEGTKRIFKDRVGKVPLDTLAEFGYNLSTSMGEFLSSQQPVDKIATIRTVFGALFPSDARLQAVLSDDGLWRLNQRRHLIVHRRSIVDAAYRTNTGEEVDLGAQLVVTPKDLEGYLILVRDAGLSLVRAFPAGPA